MYVAAFTGYLLRHLAEIKCRNFIGRALQEQSFWNKDIVKHVDIPPAWDYNPSSWSQRLPLVIVAFVGFLIASYLGAYQLRIIKHVWDPSFGNGSERILNSSVSRVLPIPDALLGALGYLLDVVSGVIGGPSRWRTMPWIVIIFGIAVGPLGMVSILLVILQPLQFHAWCTLCLASALISIIMISPATDELLASLQYLQRAKRHGHSFWAAFWGKPEVTHRII